MIERLKRISEAAGRTKEPEGRWMRLESVLKPTPSKGNDPRRAQRRFRKRAAKESAWVVAYPGVPQVGQRIRVRKENGETQERYVQQIVMPALERRDGRSIVTVSKIPVLPREATARQAEAPPVPKPPPALRQRNPRICEECEGPCRPGAGACDGCKAAM